MRRVTVASRSEETKGVDLGRPIRVELAQSTPNVLVHVHEPRALFVSDRNCDRVAGLGLRAWRKVARAMSSAGLPVTTTADGLTARTSDVERWLSEHAPALPVETEEPKTTKAEDMSDAELMRRGGLRVAG